MFLWFPVLDLARAPRRTARKKGSGYENALLAGENTLAGAGHVTHRKLIGNEDGNRVARFLSIKKTPISRQYNTIFFKNQAVCMLTIVVKRF
jgi:hypothetical protein